jgi:hypothetical protein
VVGFSISPSTVNTAAGDQQVTFRMHVTDDFSGVKPNSLSVWVSRPDGTGGGIGAATAWTRISGTDRDGIWEQTITLIQYSPQGTYTVSAAAYDRADNQTFMNTSALTNAGFPTTIQNG